MKKSLSLLVAIAMVFSMFAAVASAAEETKLTTEQKYEELVKAGLFEGYDDGEAHLDRDMTRAQASKIVALLTGYSEGVEVKDAGYTDLVGAGWATDYINYATQVGILEGKGNNKFDPSAKVTVQQLATIAVKLAKHADVTVPAGEEVEGKVDAWAAEAVASAIAAGLLAKQDDYTVNANRGLLVEVVYSAKEILAQAGALAIAKVEQTNATEITVFFNKEVSADQKKDLTFEVKSEDVPFAVTAKYADDNKSVVLSATYLPAGEYQVTVKGFEAKTLKIVEAVATKIEIGAVSLQRAENQDPKVQLLNQFGKAIENADLNVTVYNASKGTAVSVGSNGKYDLTGGVISGSNPAKFAFDVDDNVVVTATDKTGLTASKTFKLVAGSAATSIKMGKVSPLEGKTRVSANDEEVVVPVELFDQYGNKIQLDEATFDLTNPTAPTTANMFEISGVTFTLSQAGIVSKVVVDKDGVMKIDLASAGTLVIYAINPANGANASTSLKVEGAPVLKTLTMNKVNSIVAAEEDIKINVSAKDNFDDVMKVKDITINTGTTYQQDQLQFVSSVPFNNAPKFNAKGELVFNFENANVTRTAIVNGYVNGQLVGQINLEIRTKAEPKKVTGIKNVLTTIVNGVNVDFSKDNVTVVDNYGRTQTASELLAATASDKVFITKTSGQSAALATTSGEVTGITTVANEFGVTKFKVEIEGVANSSFEFSVNVVKPEDVKSYSIKAIDTIYGGKIGGNALTADSAHAKVVVLVGKIGSTEVAINQATAFDFVTAEGSASVGKNADDKYAIFGTSEGESVVTAYKNGEKLAETTVKVATATPVISKVEFGKAEYELTGTATIAVVVKVTDQYGVAIADNGKLSSTDETIATVNTVAGPPVAHSVTGVNSGTVTVKYITSNNLSATTVVVVN